MDAWVTWKQNLAFTGGADSGFTVPLDAELTVGGEGNGFQPIELMLVSLAGCTGMDALSILQKKRQDVTSFGVKVHAERTDRHPRVFTEIEIEYLVHGRGVDPAAVERAIELSETKYCPAQAMLGQAVPIRHTYRIVEEEAAAV